jgi:hypothetical protein
MDHAETMHDAPESLNVKQRAADLTRDADRVMRQGGGEFPSPLQPVSVAAMLRVFGIDNYGDSGYPADNTAYDADTRAMQVKDGGSVTPDHAQQSCGVARRQKWRRNLEELDALLNLVEEVRWGEGVIGGTPADGYLPGISVCGESDE